MGYVDDSSRDSFETTKCSSETLHLISDEPDFEEKRPNENRVRPLFPHICWAVVHIVLITAYSLLYFLTIWTSHNQQGLLKSEFDGARSAVVYEDIVFNGSMFWNRDPNRPISAYEGPPTPQTEAAWERFIDNLRIGITRAENEQLEIPSVAAYDDATVFPVVVAGYHHLHCLSRLRHIAWGNLNPGNETDDIRIRHNDHCIEDLRSALMCQPDLTVFPLKYVRWNEAGMPLSYENNVNIHHTCRSWDHIEQWASKRSDIIRALPNFPGAVN